VSSRALASLAAIAASTAGFLVALAGCPSTVSTSLYTPITGFIIDSEQLTAGLGCGTGRGQVYKYAAVVTLPDKTLESGVFDCFTNGQFGNLPTPDGGTIDYPVAIYAYDEAAFPVELAACVDVSADAACAGEDPTTVLRFAKAATWTASCTATEIQGISQVAVCSALVPGAPPPPVGDAGDAGDSGEAGEAGPVGPQPSIAIETQAFVGAEGGTLRCKTEFDHVQAAFDAGVEAGATPPTACPVPVVISPAIPGASYAITATLTHRGAVVGTASCQATAVADASGPVVATCGPAGP
jgi:hypothetical protein